MTRKVISQREARELQRRVTRYEAREELRRDRWTKSYPGGTNIAQVTLDTVTAARISTARTLRHSIVATLDGQTLMLYALPAAKDIDA